MRIFISGIDSYIGAAVKKLILDDHKKKEEESDGEGTDPLEIVGSVGTVLQKPKGVTEIALSDDVDKVTELARSADQIIIDTHKSVLEATHILKALKNPYEGSKNLVLVSTLLTWSNSVKEILEEEEDEATDEFGKNYVPFKEENFMSRKPSPPYLVHKRLESQVLALAHADLSTTVFACGILYGDRQMLLHDFFRDSWLCQDLQIPAFNNACRNFIPMVHVYDLSRAVLNALNTPPTQQYIVAVDDSTPRVCEVIQAIHQSLKPGSKPAPVASKQESEEMLLANKAWGQLQCNLKFESGGAMDSIIGGENWVCKSGIIENIEEVKKEYIVCNDLRPMKLVMMGPPGSGKSALARALSEKYYLPVVDLEGAIRTLSSVIELNAEPKKDSDDTKDDADAEEEGEGEEQEASKAQVLHKLVSQYGSGDEIPSWLRQRLIRFILQTPPCLNQGYVLDGFPQNYKDANRLFIESTDEAEEAWQNADEEGNEDEEETKVDDEEALVQENIKPTAIIMLQADVEKLQERAIEKSTEEAYDAEERFKENLHQFEKNNSPTIARTPLSFFENKCRLETLEVNTSQLDIASCKDTAALYVEQGGAAYNYHPTREEIEAEEAKRRAQELATLEEDRKKIAELERGRKSEEEERSRNEAARKEIMQKQEDQLLESRSKPLREYLLQNVMPTLSAGLVECCRAQPEDPVDFLAEFLFRNSVKK